MPTRRLLRLFFLAGLVAPLCAFALGVGQLEVRSALNQTFEAELPLIINNPAELTGLAVQIPRQEDFNRAGVERLESLSKLRFSVQTPPGGPNVVKMTSLEPIREPNFNLLLELVWPRGRLIREFTVQLDPELYANRRQPPPPPPAVVAPVAVAPAAPRLPPAAPRLPPAPPVSFEGASFYGPVKSGETLAAIANRVRPSTAISVPRMMAILMAGNPAAFANGNPNTLRSGATLKVPTPQALGVPGTPAPSSPELAVAPTSTEPTVAPAPVDLTTPSPAAVSAPEPVFPLTTAESGTPPPSATPTPLPKTAPAVAALPPAEPLRDIVPQAAIPPTETPLAPITAVTPETAAPPPAATQPQPASAAPPPAAKPPVSPPDETESSWMSNPVVWLAIALIVLAIAAVILLPLLRRPVRPKPSAVEATALESAEAAPATLEPPAAPTQTQVREPRSVRPRPAAGLAAAAPAAPGGAESMPGPVGVPTSKPIEELLKDFDFGLGEGGAPPTVARQGAVPARDLKAPLLEAEPPTASVTGRPIHPFADTSTELSGPEKELPSRLHAELPSELRLDGLDFDFGDLGLDRTARPQPSELPPLEMKPAASGAKKPSDLPSLELGIAEPATEPPFLASTVAAPAGPAMADLKFEFTDVTQELARYGAPEDSLNLDEALQGLGGEPLKLGGKAEDAGGAPSGGMDAADYVETKLDLASAYLDMGDQVGARSLLEEALREGSATQKQRAGELLKKLG